MIILIDSHSGKLTFKEFYKSLTGTLELKELADDDFEEEQICCKDEKNENEEEIVARRKGARVECSGIRLKNFFLRLNPPLAVKVNRKHCVGSLGFSFLVSLGVACPSPNTPIPHNIPQYPRESIFEPHSTQFDIGCQDSSAQVPCVPHYTSEQHATATSKKYLSQKKNQNQSFVVLWLGFLRVFKK